MANSLFNAELRDCARINEVAQQREVSRDEQAYHNACDQGHDWDDYDPVDLYGAEWDNHAVREWDCPLLVWSRPDSRRHYNIGREPDRNSVPGEQ